MNVKVDEKMTVEGLDSFMQEKTDENIVNEARKSMKDGNGRIQQCEK